MNRPIDPSLLHSSEAFAHYLKNTAFRVDERAEAGAHTQGQRVGISRPHESAHLHVAGEAAYIDKTSMGEFDAVTSINSIPALPAFAFTAMRNAQFFVFEAGSSQIKRDNSAFGLLLATV